MKRVTVGFTLVELLVVIGILLVLAGLLVPAVFQLRYKAKVAETAHLLGQMSAAIDRYLGHWPLLGPRHQGAQMLRRPMDYLVHNNKSSLLELKHQFMVYDLGGEGAGPWRAGSSVDFTHLGDSWRSGIRVLVDNNEMPGLPGRLHTTAVVVRSTGGTDGDMQLEDDIVRKWDRTQNAWFVVELKDVEGSDWETSAK